MRADLGREVEVLFVAFPLLELGIFPLAIQADSYARARPSAQVHEGDESRQDSRRCSGTCSVEMDPRISETLDSRM